MKYLRLHFVILTLAVSICAPQHAYAQPVYKIGASVALTGYIATVDRAWRDGVQLAVEFVNARGGVMGRKLELVAEDNRSEPQEAVTVYRKMMSADKVDIFISGCVSAGNFAAAPLAMQAQIPMVLCSVLPQNRDHVKWAFSTLPPARFEVEKRLEYLRDNTSLRKVGLIHDPTPYANLQKAEAEKAIPAYGLQLTNSEQYGPTDADMSAQISKLNSQGATAILKLGLGGSTLTIAKNIKQLGVPQPLLTSVEDLSVFRPIGEILGDKFFFVASPSQVYDVLPNSALKKAIGDFLSLWRAKYGDRDPNHAGRGWDGVMITAAAIQRAKSFEGSKVRDALETVTGLQGTTAVYNFSAENHYGITENPYMLATMAGKTVKIVK